MMLFYLISRPSLDLSHQSPPSDLSPWFLLVWSRAVVSLCRTVWSVTSGSSKERVCSAAGGMFTQKIGALGLL